MKKTALTLATAFTLSTGLFATSIEAAEYAVKKGDSLWHLSQTYNTSVQSIMDDNSLSSTVIIPEETLYINEADQVKAEMKSSSKAMSTYVVRPGDTLLKIAKANGVSVNQLVKWNKLSSENLIFAGDTLALNEASEGLAKVTYVEADKALAKQQQPAKQTQPASTTAPVSGNVARTLTMESTAYTAYCTGCSGVTANGTNLRTNPNLKVIAVDPSVIPLGTRVWVEGYGEAIAADTGGAIKGNKIDVFLPTDNQAYAWGRKSVTVKILN